MGVVRTAAELRRDRSQSGSRSVEFRVEIGRNPARDRSKLVSRCDVRASETGVPVSGVVVLGVGSCKSRASPLWASSAGACVCLCLSGMVGVAHSRMLRVGGNRGIMRNSNVSSGRGPAPMCDSEDKQVSPTTPCAEISPIQLDQLDVEARTTSSRAKATCHAPRNRRRAADPRSTTDLDTSYDRSRGGIRPISVRRWTDLGEGVRGSGQGRSGPVRVGQGQGRSGPVGAGQWLSGASGLL